MDCRARVVAARTEAVGVMTAADWERVKEAFLEALALKPEERDRYLEGIDDDAVRTEVHGLLAAHTEKSHFLDKPAAAHLFPGSDGDGESWIGRRVGAYKITEEIGRGGMSRVYRASRDDGQFEQEVAVKILHPALETHDFIERFRSERQVLAGFNHPNIARLFDGGRTEDGILYLVMECIHGRDLFEYCETHGLGVRERLELFRTLCAAVQYVHQRLTIHGDLKCRNVLVTEDGGVKLLDFGLARLLGNVPAEHGTDFHGMTPNYASPEQLRGEALTTSTDIYSLGVMLHRLLTKHLPARAGDGSAVGAGVQGDLQKILEKALQKDPANRYASVEQFSDDLRRYLLRRPITARESTVGYVVGRFVQRHTIAVVASGLFVLILIGTTIAMTWQAHIIGIERARAENRFNDVRKLANSLIFDIHDSISDLPGAQKSRHVLIDTAMRYLDSLSREATGDPALHRELAAAYLRLGDVQGRALEANESDYAGAQQSYRHSLALLTASLAAKPKDADTRRDLVVNCGKLSDLLWHMGDGAGALSFSQQTVTNSEVLADSDPSNKRYQALLATSRLDYGFKLFNIRGDTVEGQKLLGQAATSLKALSSADPVNQRLVRTLSLAYGRMAEILKQEHRYADALASQREALRLQEGLRGAVPENADYRHLAAFSKKDAAWFLAELGRVDEAKRVGQASLDEFRALTVSDPGVAEYRTDVSRALGSLAHTSLRAHEADRAIALLTEALKEIESVPASESDSGYVRMEKAEQELLMGEAIGSKDPKSAQEWYQKALADYQALSPTWAEAAEQVRDLEARVAKR
jgi:eukaryotic-like serine/threonine-protein kinase